ncbi:Putative uncharacterized protein [Avibacterium paragallinarum JF4211]|nr:Putative uncharacterized protein [Avibacterium paragallinarum JF4211]
MKNLCTLNDLRTVYSLGDLLDFHSVVVEMLEAEQNATE